MLPPPGLTLLLIIPINLNFQPFLNFEEVYCSPNPFLNAKLKTSATYVQFCFVEKDCMYYWPVEDRSFDYKSEFASPVVENQIF